MEADFMEYQVRFHNNFLLILFYCLTLFSCRQLANEVPEKKHLPALSRALDKQQQKTETLNGLCYYNDTLFTGLLYLLDATGDTLTSEMYYLGREHGCWKSFYANRQLAFVRYFESGVKQKNYSAFWPNGKPRCCYYFLDGEYEGNAKEWNEAGLLVKDGNYEKGYEVGHQRSWYDNGKIRSNYYIINGVRYGLLGTKNCVNIKNPTK